MQELSHLVSIVRRHNELSVLLTTIVRVGEGGRAFEIASVPFSTLTQAVYPARQQLHTSWNYLSSVQAADAQTLFHVLLVLLETVPALPSDVTPAPLPSAWDNEIRAPRATNAHPRGFKGTKYQPPKNPRLPPLDVRQYLCDASTLKKLLAPLWKFLPAAVELLEAVGYSKQALDTIDSLVAPRLWTLPPLFIQHIWALIRNRPWREISKYYSLYATLNLGRDPKLLSMFVRLLALSPGDVGRSYDWGLMLAALPTHRRTVFLEKRIETRAYVREPEAALAKRLEEVAGLATDEHFPSWTQALLLASSVGNYVSAGFRMAAQFQPDYRFDRIGKCENFPEHLVEEIAIRVADDSHGGWFAMALWERCGRFPGFADIIGRCSWRRLADKTVYRYFQFLNSLGYDNLPERKLQEKWKALLAETPGIEKLIAETSPDFQVKVVSYLEDWIWYWDTPSSIKRWMPRVHVLLPRLAAEPFSKGPEAATTVGWILEIGDERVWRRAMAAPDASYQALERACRRQNAERSVALGIKSLSQSLASFTIDALYVSPKKLARTAEVLGGVGFPIRKELLEKCRQHPLFQLDVLQGPAKTACMEIKASLRDTYANPIPARLSAWARGDVELTEMRIERYRRIMAEQLIITRLDVIEQAVIDWLRQDLPIERVNKEEQHALRMLGSAEENRRGLRKFLRAYWSGNKDYLSNHPATRAWYRKHAALKRSVWENGIPFTVEGGRVAITVERDPLEILKLGTYVGSCLSVGGSFSYSAVAALLDANKKVLYARDRNGNVIARQLVAISDDNQLVCFYVYPASSTAAVKAMFRDYDHAFARALDLPLYLRSGPGDKSYEIENVLSVYWWDDSEWDFKIED